MDLQNALIAATGFASSLEGPYKWYVIGGAALFITVFVTQFIFKTFKWAILLLFFGLLLFGAFYALTQVSGTVY